MRYQLFFLASLLAFARDPVANPALEAGLRSAYVWTNADGRTGDIINPGTILVVRQDGITTNPADAPFHAQNNYKDGQVKRSALNIFAQDQSTAGRLMAGDRVFVTKTEVKETSVVFSLLSVDTFHGMRVKASVAFQFPKGALASMEFPELARTVDELLAQEAPPPRAAIPSARHQPTAPGPPSTIGLGATVDQVLSAAGEPGVVADLGRKLIFLYPDIKVIFLDGKVTDVH